MHRHRLWMGVLLVAGLAASQPALAQTAAERIETANKLLTTGKFAEAAKVIEAALAQPNTEEATVVTLYEQSGIAAASLKQAQKARLAFQRVLSLDPPHKLTGKWPAKVTAAFTEARKSMARAGGPLSVEQLTPEIKGGLLVGVYFSVENDVLKLGKKARVHLRQDGGAWTKVELPLVEPLKADVSAKAVEWWVQLLGEHGEVLAHLASEDKPIVELVPGATLPKPGTVAAKTTTPPGKTGTGKTGAPVADKKAELTPPPKEPGPVVVAPVEPKGKVRVLPWVLVGAGVAAGGAGAIFGVKAQGERARIANASVDGQGVVTGITRAQALQLDSQARTDSAIANTLMGAGVGLAVTGVVVWFLGREEAHP